jgi:S1-C subfamily serine protease
MRTTSITVLLAASLIAGCGSGDHAAKTTKTTTDVANPQVDPARAVVSIQGVYDDHRTDATGVIYDARQGLLLTADHPVEGAPSINVTFSDGSVSHARLVARAQCHDLAVLRVFPRQPGLTQMPIARTDKVALGQPVHTLSYLFEDASGHKKNVAQVSGTVSATNVRQTFMPLPPAGPFIAHQSSLPPSASGSPLLDEHRQMIGLNTLVGHPRENDAPGMEYALSATYIRTRLGQLRPGPGGTLGGWESEHNRCHHLLLSLIGKGHIHEPPADMGHGAAGEHH